MVRRLAIALALAMLVAGCAWMERNVVARGEYGSSTGARGEVGLRF